MNSRLLYILIYIFISYTAIYSDSLWIPQQSPTSNWLVRCSFPDSLNGWAAGDSGIIVHTSNGGLNWSKQNNTFNIFINDIFFLNRRLGWAVAVGNFYGSIILHTTNGGINWSSSVYPDTMLFLNTVYFLDSLNGWLGGIQGVILKTTNGGSNWTQLRIDTSICSQSAVLKFHFRNPQFGFACGGNRKWSGVVWKSTDFGTSWIGRCIPNDFEPVNDFSLIDSLRIIAVGGDYKTGPVINRSYDGGNTWDYTLLSGFAVCWAISFRIPNEAWVPMGGLPFWYYTLDTGNHWSQLLVTDSAYIYDVKFTDPYHGWAVGYSGVILKYNSSLIGISNNNYKVPDFYKLNQNYPNPFNPSTTISYFLVGTTRVRITVFDLEGRELKILLDEIQSAGEHKIKFSAPELASGIYFYKLQAGKFTEAKKMVILR